MGKILPSQFSIIAVRHCRSEKEVGSREQHNKAPSANGAMVETGNVRWLRLRDFAGLDAAGTNAKGLGSAVHQRFHLLQIDVPAPPGNVVGV